MNSRRRGANRRGADQPHRPLPGAATQPIVVIDADERKRWPIWAEIDSNANNPAKARRWRSTRRELRRRPPLHRRPARPENASGETIEAPAAFRYYRDECALQTAEDQRAPRAFREHLPALQQGRHQTHKTSTWPGTSPLPATRTTPPGCWHAQRGLRPARRHEPRGRIPRATSPSFQCHERENSRRRRSRIAREVKGTFTVPCYLSPNCAPGGTFQLDANGRPRRTAPGPPTSTASSRARRSAAPAPARPSLYGHGLFGSAAEVASSAAARARQTPQLRPLRHRRDRMSPSGDPCTIGSCRSSRASRDRRPPAAGPARRALPRPGDDPPERLQQRARLPRRRHPRHAAR